MFNRNFYRKAGKAASQMLNELCESGRFLCDFQAPNEDNMSCLTSSNNYKF